MSGTTPPETTEPSESAIDFGQPAHTVRWGLAGSTAHISFLVFRRSVVACFTLVLLCLATFVTALCVGDYVVSPAGVVAALRGTADDLTHLVVVTWRVPRASAACALGAALGVAGAIFQSLTRNPLGSPDIIGFSTGSFTGATVAILYWDAGFVGISVAAFVGGLATALVVYLLAHTGGSVGGFRLIVIGIAISAMLSSATTAMMTGAEVEDAMRVAIWGAGTLKALTYEQVIPAAVTIGVALVICCGFARSLKTLELGDDLSQTLGVRLGSAKLGLIILGVLLTAVAAATAGPISFLALAAPQLARRLCRSDGIPLVASGLLGALLLQVSDIVAENVYPPSPLPVGVVTICLGGGYFMWLLIGEARKR